MSALAPGSLAIDVAGLSKSFGGKRVVLRVAKHRLSLRPDSVCDSREVDGTVFFRSHCAFKSCERNAGPLAP